MLFAYRGKPVARFVPIRDESVRENNLFYSLGDLADSKGMSLRNAQMDKIIYGA